MSDAASFVKCEPSFARISARLALSPAPPAITLPSGDHAGFWPRYLLTRLDTPVSRFLTQSPLPV